MNSRYILPFIPANSFFIALLLGLPGFFVQQINAQGCGCTNCPQFMPDNFQGDFLISVNGADNPTLGQNGQGVCGVTMHFDHEYIGDLSITLTSPSGQSVTLVGPIGLFGETDGTSWDISFVPCGDQAFPDPGFTDQWDNNQPWDLNNMYFGSYYPSLGCLEDFNSGPVDGTWTLTVVDGQNNDVGNFYDYEIIFCDPSGILCFSCEADAGDLNQNNVVACQGSADLNLSLDPTYVAPASAPPATEYSYTYVVSGAGGVILAYELGPDLTAYDAGVYNVCGLSYYTLQESDIPAPDGSLTVAQLSAQLDGSTPPFCGNISGNCVGITINENPADEEEFAEICAPDCYNYYNTDYCQTGTYTKTITTAQGCKYQATLNLIVHQPANTTLNEVVCDGECATTEGFENQCSPGSYQQVYQTIFGCDSIVTLNLQVLAVVATAVPTSNLDCNTPSIQISGAGSSSGSSVNYQWSASNGGHIVGSSTNLNVLVDEGGDYQLRVCRTGGGAYCCDSVEVTVLDNSAVPPVPVVQGNANACPGSSATYSVADVVGATAYNWTITNGTINSGQGSNTVQVTWDINAASGILCANASNMCGASSDNCLNVSLSVPVAGQITTLCNATNSAYTVSFPVSGGTAPYTIPGGVISGGIFTSDSILSGLPYSFQITDANLCVSTLISGSFNCSCATSAGNMSLMPLKACENDTVQALHLGGQALDANDVTAYVLHSGSGTALVPPIFGQNNSGSFSFQPGMVYGQTYYISLVAGNNLAGLPDPNDPCLSVAQGQAVTFFQNPVANAGMDHDTCGLTQLLSANASVGIGVWTVISGSAVDTLNIVSPQNPNTAVTASGHSLYTLSWTLNNNGCIDADTVVLDFNPSPSLYNEVYACDGANENYTVTFEIGGGSPGYTLSGTPGGVNIPNGYQSDPIPNGGSYNYQVIDTEGCASPPLTGSFSCSCATNAGAMNLNLLSTCEGGSITAQHLGGQTLDANDTVSFVLHTLPGTTLGQILDQNTSGVFSFAPGMVYGTTYYVSYVVGNNLQGIPNLQDPCLSVTPGQPVVFYQNPVSNAGPDQSICGTQLTLNANTPAGSTGNWTISNSPAGSNLNLSDSQSATATASATTPGTYTLTWTLAQNGCLGTDAVQLQFNESPVLDNLVRNCDAANENFSVTLSILGGTAPYTVNGQAVAGNSFVSALLPNGATYSFTVVDANGCPMPTINGAYSCNCVTNAGSMSAQTIQACAGQTLSAVASGNASLDPNDGTAYVLHNGAGPALGQIFGQNLSGTFAFDPAQMSFGTTYYISLVAGNLLNGFPDPLDPCFSVAPGQPVQWLENPSPNAGADLMTCGQSIDLQAVNGNFNGTWTLVSGPGTASFINGNDPGSTVNVSIAGNYVFRWTELNGVCPGTDEVNAVFHALPEITAVQEICNGANTAFNVVFTVNNGLAPYSISGLSGSFTGNQFNSLPLPTNSSYAFVLEDANGCQSPDISGAHNCACATDAGSMETTPASFCADLPATATWNNDASTDSDDLIQFILHDAAGAVVGNTVFATSNQPSFVFGGSLQLGVTYYISAIAGNNVQGQVDLNDPCLSVTPGTPVQWKPLPNATLSGDATLCLGGNTLLSFNGAGVYPLTIQYSEGQNLNNLVLTGPQTVTLEVTPFVSTTYSLLNVTDGTTPNCSTALSGAATVVVNQPVDAGTPGATLEFCSGASASVQLSSLLSGADVGGQWTETSALPSQAGAFNAANGSFQINGQAPGLYSFRYKLTALSPCTDDESTVTVRIHPAPSADAGLDKTLNCNVLDATLGGSGSSAGTYRWILNGDTLGTDRTLSVTEGGAYSLLVRSSEGCTDTDVVLVSEDNEVPVATLVTARDVRCFGEHNGAVSVEAVASGHLPVYYSLNGGPFVSSSLFTGLSQGSYVITLQDANGCESQTSPLQVNEPSPLTADLGADLKLELADSAHVVLQSSVTTQSLQSILWQPLLDTMAAGLPYQNFLPYHSWELGVTLTDSSGCQAKDRILVQVSKPRHIYIPNVFKPDADFNQLLYVFGGRDVASIESFQIFDRWGEMLFEQHEIQPNDDTKGWDGRAKGEKVNPGVFVYLVRVRFVDGEVVVFRGDFTVVR